MNNQNEHGDLQTLPVLALKNTVLFPNLFLPLTAGRDASIAAVEAAMAREDKTLVLLTQRDATVEQPGPDDLHTVGTRGVIKKVNRTEHGLQFLVQGLERLVVVRIEQTQPYLAAKVRPMPVPDDGGVELEALHRAVLEQAAHIIEFTRPQNGPELTQLASQVQDPLHLAYLIGSLLGLDVQKEQALLEAPTRLETLRLLFATLAHELQVLELRQQDRQQGPDGDEQGAARVPAAPADAGHPGGTGREEPRRRPRSPSCAAGWTRPTCPSDVRKEAERELTPAGRAAAGRAGLPGDAHVPRAGAGTAVEEGDARTAIDLNHARKVLDEDHYGLEEVKERILEHLAVLKLNPQAKAPILLPRRPAGRRQDVAGPVDRPGAGPQVRAAAASAACTTRRSCAATAAPTSARCRAGSSRRSAGPASTTRC